MNRAPGGDPNPCCDGRRRCASRFPFRLPSCALRRGWAVWLDADAVFRGFGGDYMKASGVELSVHYQQMAFMGFVTLIANYGIIRRMLRLCKDDIVQFKPDVVILIDRTRSLRIKVRATRNRPSASTQWSKSSCSLSVDAKRSSM